MDAGMVGWRLGAADWTVIGVYLAGSVAIGLLWSRRASRDVGEFFLSGRSLPWWLVGTSMVATTFAADTPLAVAGLVGRHGVSGNWTWWNFGFGNVLTVVFFAHLWRRAGISTDVELCELRYGDRPAALLRGFRAVWLGLVLNAGIIGWVNLAMAKILAATLGWGRLAAVLVCFGLTGAYAAFSGLWGVIVTDAFQFALAIAGCTVLAVLALGLPEVGGLDGLRASLPAEAFQLLPDLGAATDSSPGGVVAISFASFLALVGVQWWSSYYPGSEPGGGGYVAQRIMSAKNERHAVLATLWFTIAHYCLRPWPWIIVGLVALKLHPTLADRETGFLLVMQRALPVGLRGLMLGAFLAAYMSTVSTQLNWGASYLVNDVYRRFLRSQADERGLVRASRLATILSMIAGGAVTFGLETVAGAWQLILESGAGLGFVLIARWYWWRVNAWSELAATVAPVIGFALLRIVHPVAFPASLVWLTAWTVAVTLIVTFATKPERDGTLFAFYRRVRPAGPGWAAVANRAGLAAPTSLAPGLVAWVAGVVIVYATLLGSGALLVGHTADALWPGVALVCAALVLVRVLRPTAANSATPVEELAP